MQLFVRHGASVAVEAAGQQASVADVKALFCSKTPHAGPPELLVSSVLGVCVTGGMHTLGHAASPMQHRASRSRTQAPLALQLLPVAIKMLTTNTSAAAPVLLLRAPSVADPPAQRAAAA